LHRAAITLQARWRGSRARIQTRSLHAARKQEAAAVVLQSWWRGYRVRQALRYQGPLEFTTPRVDLAGMLAPPNSDERQALVRELGKWQDSHPVDFDKGELSLKLYEQQLAVKGYLQELPKTLRQVQARQSKLNATARLRDRLLGMRRLCVCLCMWVGGWVGGWVSNTCLCHFRSS
jgi:hypothetical protein